MVHHILLQSERETLILHEASLKNKDLVWSIGFLREVTFCSGILLTRRPLRIFRPDSALF